MSTEDRNANPLDAGSDANSVESAGAAFTTMLENEGKPSQSDRRRPPRSEPRGDDDRLFGDVDDFVAPDPDEADDNRQSSQKRDRANKADEDDQSSDDVDDALGDDPEDEDEKDPEDAEDDEPEDQPDDEDEADDEADDEDLDREFTVKVNGEEKPVPLRDILAGYMQEADYRQRTAALAEERQEVVEFANETVAERKKYETVLSEFQELAAALEPSADDWAKLKSTDPNLYIQMQEQWTGIRAKVEEAKAEQAEIAKREAQDQIRSRNDWIVSENKKLREKIPALNDPKQADKMKNLILSYGKRAGYSEEELMSGLVDHRDTITMIKAARYDEIQRNRKSGQREGKKGENRGENRPRVKTLSNAPSSRPRSFGKKSRTRSERDADRRLARSGSMDDAAAGFDAMIKAGL